MENILVIGGANSIQLELEQSLMLLGKVSFLNFSQKEVSDDKKIYRWFNFYNPSVVINLLEEKNNQLTDNLKLFNEFFPKVTAKWCFENDALFVHLSTNKVFSYVQGVKYKEDDDPNPCNSYGLSKLIGEKNIFSNTKHCIIIRSPLLVGINDFNKTHRQNLLTENIFSMVIVLVLKKYLSITDRFSYGIYHIQLNKNKFIEKVNSEAGGDLNFSKFEREFKVKIPPIEDLILIYRKKIKNFKIYRKLSYEKCHNTYGYL